MGLITYLCSVAYWLGAIVGWEVGSKALYLMESSSAYEQTLNQVLLYGYHCGQVFGRMLIG